MVRTCTSLEEVLSYISCIMKVMTVTQGDKHVTKKTMNYLLGISVVILQ
jgi:hypothetical protein